MKILYVTTFLVLSTGLFFTACSNDEDTISDEIVIPDEEVVEPVPLQISVSIAELTRSLITESGFKDNTSIGVSMMYVNGEDYGEGNKNQKYTSVGIGTKQVWKSAADVKVSSRSGYAVACYPYSEKNNDFTAIPIDNKDCVDYMYGSVAHVNRDKPQACLVMRHAMAGIMVRFSKTENYAGDESISNIRVSSKALGKKAVLNALKGTISNIENLNAALNFEETFTSITTNPEETTTEMITAVPNINEKVDMTLSFQIGQAENSIDIVENVAFAMGKIYVIDVEFRPGKLVVSNVSIYDWENNGNYEGFIRPEN